MSAKKKAKVKRPPKWAILTPKKLTDGRWMVSQGKVDGKYPRRFFQLRADAQDFCNDEKARRREHGSITAGTDGARVALWMNLDAKLGEGGHNLSTIESWLALDQLLGASGAGCLMDAGKRVLRDAESIRKAGTAQTCLDIFVATKSPSIYADDIRNRGGRFVREFGGARPVSEITPEVMTAYFAKVPGASSRRTISAWLGWAAEEGWLPANPCTRKRRKGTKGKRKRESVILTPADSAALLRAAVHGEDWVVLSYLVLGLFGGIRPMEFRKKPKGSPALEWAWNCIKPAHLVMPPELAKTGVGRVIPISSTLKAWLNFIRTQRGVLSGPILKVGKRGGGWRKHWETFLENYWPQPWHADQLRHCYGSYTLAKSKDASSVAMAMGNSPEVVLDHYWNWKTLSTDAKEFFALTPELILVSEKIKIAKPA